MLLVDEQIKDVLRLREDENKTFTDIASLLGISDRTARRRYEAGILQRTAGVLADDKLESLPDIEPVVIKVSSDYIPEENEEIKRFKPLVVKGDAILTCDFHVPLCDVSQINVMIRAAKKYGIKKLVVAGDYFHMEDVSSYPPYQPEAAMNLEKKQGIIIMKTLLRWFEEVTMIWGNHEHRLSRSTGFKYSFTECMKWMLQGLTDQEMSRIRFSDLDYMYYYPGGNSKRKIRVCHPQNFSDIPLAVGLKLAKKYTCSVYTAHSHHCAIGAATNGDDLIIEGGGFFDKSRTEYIQRTNPNHEWVQGFFYFKDGIPHMVSPLIGNDLEYRKEGKINARSK